MDRELAGLPSHHHVPGSKNTSFEACLAFSFIEIGIEEASIEIVERDHQSMTLIQLGSPPFYRLPKKYIYQRR